MRMQVAIIQAQIDNLERICFHFIGINIFGLEKLNSRFKNK
jgi:hypothetical protein